MFPSGLGYDKLNEKVQTSKVNSIFSSIPLVSIGLDENEKGDFINIDKISFFCDLVRVTIRLI